MITNVLHALQAEACKILLLLLSGPNTSPQSRGPFQKFSSRKTRSGELPRRHSSSSGLKEAPNSPQESGGSMPQPQATPFSHSNTWGPRTGPPPGAVAGALASASGGPVGPRAAPPSTPPQQPGGEAYGLHQVLCLHRAALTNHAV